LLRLPSEIREKILINLVGENLLHIKHLDRWELADVKKLEAGDYTGRNYITTSHEVEGAFRHSICTAKMSEQTAYDELVAGRAFVPADESPDFYVASCKKRHQDCKLCGPYPWGIDNENSQCLRVNLGVLGVCRQIYEEANHLLWSTNTFSFDDATSFNKFLQSLNPAQKRNLTSLHFNASIGGYYASAYEWSVALKISYMNMLRSVQNLHLCFENAWARSFPDVGEEGDEDSDVVEAAIQRGIEPFLRLRALPLKNVTVVLSDSHPKLPPGTARWSLAEKLAYADDLRTQMLNPQGPGLVKADNESRKATERQQGKEFAERSAALHKDRAIRAFETAGDMEKAALDAESEARRELKKLKDAKTKTVNEMTELQHSYQPLKRMAEWSRSRANNAAETAKRCHIKADDKAAKAERAKARFEGRKVKKAGKGNEESEEEEGSHSDKEE
jgi:hypothetical protein